MVEYDYFSRSANFCSNSLERLDTGKHRCIAGINMVADDSDQPNYVLYAMSRG